MSDETTVSVTEAAEILGITRQAVLGRVKRGTLQVICRETGQDAYRLDRAEVLSKAPDTDVAVSVSPIPDTAPPRVDNADAEEPRACGGGRVDVRQDVDPSAFDVDSDVAPDLQTDTKKYQEGADVAKTVVEGDDRVFCELPLASPLNADGKPRKNFAQLVRANHVFEVFRLNPGAVENTEVWEGDQRNKWLRIKILVDQVDEQHGPERVDRAMLLWAGADLKHGEGDPVSYLARIVESVIQDPNFVPPATDRKITEPVGLEPWQEAMRKRVYGA